MISVVTQMWMNLDGVNILTHLVKKEVGPTL
jgi:hypothetical protein